MSGRTEDPSSLRYLDSSWRTSLSYSVSGRSSLSVRLRLLASSPEGAAAAAAPSVAAEEGRLPRLLLRERNMSEGIVSTASESLDSEVLDRTGETHNLSSRAFFLQSGEER